MKPFANKSKMVAFLRARGYDVPSIHRAEFINYRRSFWLDWEDSSGVWHRAYYSAAAGRQIFSINQNFIDITLSDVIEHGMVSE